MARTGHLVALKVLSRAREAVALIAERGFDWGRNLVAEINALLRLAP